MKQKHHLFSATATLTVVFVAMAWSQKKESVGLSIVPNLQSLELVEETRTESEKLKQLLASGMQYSSLIRANIPNAVTEGNYPNALTDSNMPSAMSRGNFPNSVLDGNFPDRTPVQPELDQVPQPQEIPPSAS